MSSLDVVAEALALGFLAGSWQRAELLERGARVLGERPPWLTRLVRHVLGEFPDAPRDRSSALTTCIRRAKSFRRRGSQARPRLVALLWDEPRMAARRWPVPELCTTVDVASWLELTPSELDWFADVRGLNGEVATRKLHHYEFRWVAKRHGGQRLLEAPKPRLKALQRRVLHELLERVPTHEAAHGFVKGRSALTCASAHAGCATLLRADLEEFFPSVGAARIFRIFRSFGYPEDVARVLTGLCTLEAPSAVLDSVPRPTFAELYDADAAAVRARSRRRLRQRHLAQGAPTSPALANLACYRFDARLTSAARAVGARYTRYADDLAFSGDPDFARRAARFETLVAAIAIEEGFRLNYRKTRLRSRAQSQKLLGLVVNEKPHVPRVERDRLEAILTNAVRHGLASQNRENSPHFLESLRGRVAWVEQANRAHGAKLRRLLASLR